MAVKRESENFTGYTLHWVSSHHSYEAFLAVALASHTGRTATPTNHHSFSCGVVHVSPSPKRRTYDVRTVGRRRRRRVRKTLLLDYYTHATRAAIHTCGIHTYGARVRASMGLRQPGTKEAPSTCFVVDWSGYCPSSVSLFVCCLFSSYNHSQ